MSSLLVFLKQKDININNVIIIKYLNMFYGICIESKDKKIVIGLDTIYYKTMTSWTIVDEIRNFKLPYDINSLIKPKSSKLTQELYHDLRNIDSNYKIYMFKKDSWTNIRQFDYSKSYLSLLGCLFFNIFFYREDYLLLEDYFDVSKIFTLFKNKHIKGINPFKEEIIYKSNRIEHYKL